MIIRLFQFKCSDVLQDVFAGPRLVDLKHNNGV